MNPKWINILGILLVYQEKSLLMAAGDGGGIPIEEGMSVDVKCRPSELGSLIIWFRVLDKGGVEYIGSFSSHGLRRSSLNPLFSDTKVKQNILTLQAFNKARDSGVYSCASLFKGVELNFGKVTRLVGEERGNQATKTTAAATRPSQCTTASPCDCADNEETEATGLSLLCTPFILGSLVGGCGFLLLLLISTAVYCNKMRTRRCPHHYKRKHPIMAGEKK